MSTFEFYENRALIGTNSTDTLTSEQANVLFGLAGDDKLENVSNTPDGYASLNGGHGNDTYVASGPVTQVTDTSGNDTIFLSAPKSSYLAGFIDGRHLIMENQWDGHLVIVLDFKGAGFVENFVDSQGTVFGGDAIQAAAYQNGVGDIPIHNYFGGFESDSNLYRALLETDIALAHVNWDNVYQRLGTQDLSNYTAVGEAVNQEVLTLLSPQGREVWEMTGAREALLSSSYTAHQNTPSVGEIPRETVEKIGLLYEAALGRMPDQGGYNYWLDTFASGASVQDIASSFMAAPEFQTLFATNSNDAFVDQLYINVLERPGEAGGVNYWLGLLDQQTATKVDVLLSFASSAENIANAEWLAGLSYNATSEDWVI